MTTAGVVIDTNVVLTWFLADEENRDQAIRVRDEIVAGSVEPVAPAHLPLEVAAALVRAVRRGRLGLEHIQPALDALDQMDFVLIDLGSIVTKAAALGLSLGLSVYDATFVAVAAERHVPLVTADLLLFENASNAGYEVIRLGDLP